MIHLVENHMLLNARKDRLLELKARRDVLERKADAFASLLEPLDIAKDTMLESAEGKIIGEFSGFISRRLVEIVTELDIYLADIADIERITGDGL